MSAAGRAPPSGAHGRKARPARAHRRRRQAVVREARQEAADRDPPFEPGQTHADALMDPRAEGDVAVRRAADVEAVGLGELLGIAVGRRRCRASPASAARMTTPPISAGAGRDPVAELVRALEAQELLDRRAGPARVWRAIAPSRRASRAGTARPLPIRLVVVSWPALSRKMQLCSSSALASCSPPSPSISRVSTSTSGSPGSRAPARDQAFEIDQELAHGAVAARRAARP
mgnify:CR=1 FL=1